MIVWRTVRDGKEGGREGGGKVKRLSEGGDGPGKREVMARR